MAIHAAGTLYANTVYYDTDLVPLVKVIGLIKENFASARRHETQYLLPSDEAMYKDLEEKLAADRKGVAEGLRTTRSGWAAASISRNLRKSIP